MNIFFWKSHHFFKNQFPSCRIRNISLEMRQTNISKWKKTPTLRKLRVRSAGREVLQVTCHVVAGGLVTIPASLEAVGCGSLWGLAAVPGCSCPPAPTHRCSLPLEVSPHVVMCAVEGNNLSAIQWWSSLKGTSVFAV